MFCSVCDKPLQSNNKCGACYKHKHSSSKVKTYQKEYRVNTTSERSIYQKEYRKNHIIEHNRANARWTQNHLDYHRAKEAKRRALKIQAIPKWVDLEAVEQFYTNCPKGYEVDHIIPLKGKQVSGLHVLNNLQYLTKSENASKGNRIKVG